MTVAIIAAAMTSVPLLPIRLRCISRPTFGQWLSLVGIAAVHLLVIFAVLHGLSSKPFHGETKPMVVRMLEKVMPPEKSPADQARPWPYAPQVAMAKSLPRPEASSPVTPMMPMAPVTASSPSRDVMQDAVLPAPSFSPAMAQPPLVPPRYDAAYLDNPKPRYPAASRRLGEEGRVTLRVDVSPEGAALSATVMESSGYPRLDAAAQAAVAQWRFVPARRGDTAISAVVRVPIVFNLEN